ncbi:hypothetical protein BRE01_15860 [Brevibacillus reuszeri]|uniref:MarR family transcriptional regulator n=1 Tax=Brevibacillus reuszeri TaxID=54915 RepID=A0A0K9Z0P5_9BACL|nr:MarR family transcriptional regulator [Brevibacillus reuszeri]KNB74496.1 MarR family transcriptional regulator [Brevibacillus reuszeri]MED1856421.1 MarR family transcriptional regulator [Brevibacillus reuszeri]GED67884.1 hypothetical protein BRE01_15860 [Brevibacillus reuszeri]
MTDKIKAYVNQPPLPTQTFFALVDATAELVGKSEKYWQSKGINGARIRVLVEIAKKGGRILPSLLAQNIGVTKANISILLTPLEQDGLIDRTSHPEDGRKTVISLTAEGQKLLLQHLPDNRQVVADALASLNEQELHQLLFLLGKIKRRED